MAAGSENSLKSQSDRRFLQSGVFITGPGCAPKKFWKKKKLYRKTKSQAKHLSLSVSPAMNFFAAACLRGYFATVSVLLLDIEV